MVSKTYKLFTNSNDYGCMGKIKSFMDLLETED